MRLRILERKKYDYQKYCSDIAGQDIAAHGGKTQLVIAAVRNLLARTLRNMIIPGATKVHQRYLRFRSELPKLRRALNLTANEVGFIEYTTLVSGWLQAHPRP